MTGDYTGRVITDRNAILSTAGAALQTDIRSIHTLNRGSVPQTFGLGMAVKPGSSPHLGPTSFNGVGTNYFGSAGIYGTYTGIGTPTFTLTCFSNRGYQAQGLYSAPFITGETVTDGLGNSGTFIRSDAGVYILVNQLVGAFSGLNVLTGSTSGHTFTPIIVYSRIFNLFTFTDGVTTKTNVSAPGPADTVISGINYTKYPNPNTTVCSVGAVWTASIIASSGDYGLMTIARYPEP